MARRPHNLPGAACFVDFFGKVFAGTVRYFSNRDNWYKSGTIHGRGSEQQEGQAVYGKSARSVPPGVSTRHAPSKLLMYTAWGRGGIGRRAPQQSRRAQRVAGGSSAPSALWLPRPPQPTAYPRRVERCPRVGGATAGGSSARSLACGARDAGGAQRVARPGTKRSEFAKIPAIRARTGARFLSDKSYRLYE